MRRILIFMGAALLCLASVGCQKKEGPAEKAGKEIDKAVNQVDSKIGEAAKEAEKKVDETAGRIKGAVDTLSGKVKGASGKMKRQEEQSEDKGNDKEKKD